MFDQLSCLPPDPILGLSRMFAEDTTPHKVDLGVGVYKDEQGQTPILESVLSAEQRLLQSEGSKAYQGPQGNDLYNQALQRLVFGSVNSSDIVTLQAPGGCGALKLAAELILLANPEATVWLSTPTWANHIPLLGGSGLQIREYPYYDPATRGLDFDAMVETLKRVPRGDIVLLHGCCHNPCGVDLSADQWQIIAEMAQQQGFIPLVDLAYQGFGDGMDEDAYGVRLLAERLPESIVTTSCSKNFGLYRERTGAISVKLPNRAQGEAVMSQLQTVARGIYSMPPAHGASLVELILGDDQLNAQWLTEVASMRERIFALRCQLSAALGSGFEFIPKQKGMFSFLGLNEAQVEELRVNHSIYMVGSSRINIAGINQANIDHLASSIKAVL